MVYLCYSVQIILHWMYFSRSAHTIEEYSDFIFRISVLTLVAACYTVYVINVEKIFEIRNMCEEIIDQS